MPFTRFYEWGLHLWRLDWNDRRQLRKARLHWILVQNSHWILVLNSLLFSDIISIKDVGLSYTCIYQSVSFNPAYDFIYHLVIHMVSLELFLYLNKIYFSSRVWHIKKGKIKKCKEKNKTYCENQPVGIVRH